MKYILLILIVISGCGIPEEDVEESADCRMTDNAVGKGAESKGIKVHLEPAKTTYLILQRKVRSCISG